MGDSTNADSNANMQQSQTSQHLSHEPASEALVLCDDFGAVRLLTLNRPAAANALNIALIDELQRQIQVIAETPGVHVVVLTGSGEKAFAAGADITELQSLTPLSAVEFSKRGHALMLAIENMRTPVIAAVKGYALGGGLELALACDFIYAGESASLGLVESNLGLIPGYGGVGRLAYRIGEAAARESLYTARRYSAAESLRLGLVNRVLPDNELLDGTLAIAQTIAGKSPAATQLLRNLFISTRGCDANTTAALEQQAFGLAFANADGQEGIRAFLEKRKPNFQSNR